MNLLKKEEEQSLNILVNHIGKVFIIAYKESTQLLEASLTKEGFNCQVLRQQHKSEYKNYSPSYLCLLNHTEAWKIAAEENQPTLIVEADFVPVIGFGQLPLPFNPKQENVGISWLYTCASQVYSVSEEGYINGFSVSSVASIVTPKAAQCLLELQKQIEENPGPTAYSSWDSNIDSFLRAKQLKNYIGFRNYGEHGGLPNLEHHKNNLSKTHRADVLYNKLAFMPMYITNEKYKYLQLFLARIKARLKGLARLFLGKFLRISVIKGSSVPFRLIGVAIKRQFSWY
jgi:GR25 family glycosyltransferase involved in LPS biosynthesis